MRNGAKTETISVCESLNEEKMKSKKLEHARKSRNSRKSNLMKPTWTSYRALRTLSATIRRWLYIKRGDDPERGSVGDKEYECNLTQAATRRLASCVKNTRRRRVEID